MTKITKCDSCKNVVAEATTFYGHFHNENRKFDLCAVCLGTRLKDVEFQVTQPRGK